MRLVIALVLVLAPATALTVYPLHGSQAPAAFASTDMRITISRQRLRAWEGTKVVVVYYWAPIGTPVHGVP